MPEAPTRRIRRPVHILGFARSGTTMLGYVFEAHPEVAVFNEPRTIWSLGNAYRPDDELGPEHLTPRIARRIDAAFAEGMARKGGSRFVEKTPSNCLRVPFLHALYPDGRCVHIIRDGRAVVRSLLKAETRAPRARRIRKRLRETPVRDWPAFVPTLLRTVWRSKVLGRPAAFWGPRPREWREWLELPPPVRVAHQWRACVERARRDGRALPEGAYMEVRYEDLVTDPRTWTRRIFEFVDLSLAPPVQAWLDEEVHGPRTPTPAGEPASDDEARAWEVMGPLLDELGYGPPGSDAPAARPAREG